MRTITRIFVHCTASHQSTTTVSSLLAEFKRKGWKNPGYHYVVFPDGSTRKLLNESLVANGVKGYNSHSIHIAYVGGVDSKLRSVDNRTDAQKATLLRILRGLRKSYPKATILGHRDISPDTNHNGIVDPWERIKDCPCFDAKVEYKDI